MNTKLIAKYLQFLRKSHNYTQDDLAKRLDISRQAVSKWETGTTLPDLEVLLKISKLYNVSINEILEPQAYPQKISDFEQIPMIPGEELEEILKQFDTHAIAAALMGASPETNLYIENLLPDIDLKTAMQTIGQIRIEEVEKMQNQIVAMINLQTP